MPHKIEIPDTTYSDLEAMLAQRGGGNVADFVNSTLQKRLFFETVAQVQQQNQDTSPEELQQAIDEAISAVRADRSSEQEETPDADRS